MQFDITHCTAICMNRPKFIMTWTECVSMLIFILVEIQICQWFADIFCVLTASCATSEIIVHSVMSVYQPEVILDAICFHNCDIVCDENFIV